MTREIIDKALDDHDARTIKTELFSWRFPWFYKNSVLNDTVMFNHLLEYKFHHIVCGYKQETTNAIHLVQPIFDRLNVASIVMCRIFMTTYTGQNVNQGFHRDEPGMRVDRPIFDHMKTAIYYVNTNNGGTLFEDGQFVNSVENRLLVFDSQSEHAAITATDVAARVVVNINYF